MVDMRYRLPSYGLFCRQGRARHNLGEFTRRAVLNGKLDLVQAEAIGDLIDASSDTMRRVVLHQLDGGLSRQIDELRDRLLQVEALLAYDIDFPEEDHGPIAPIANSRSSTAVASALKHTARTAPATELVREGAVVVIAGPTKCREVLALQRNRWRNAGNCHRHSRHNP